MKFSIVWALPTSKEGVDWTQIGEARLPGPFTAVFEFPEDHRVELDIVVKEESPTCEAIRVQRNPARPPLSGAELRRLPIHNWVTMATAQAALTPSKESRGAWSPPSEEEARQLWGQVEERVSRRTMTDDHLREVATEYREALKHDERGPREAIGDKYRVAPSTAARYIKLARDRGFLGKAPGPGKKGER